MKIKKILLFLISTFTVQVSSFALDTELHGFAETRAGARTQDDPAQNQMSLGETRLQLDALTYFDAAELQIRTDFLYDGLQDDLHKIDLDRGTGFMDLRELNLLFTPIPSADVKIGRQILTWGTGDLLFINDLFPKDWNSFLLGRDEDYLKAPSDALFVSWFPAIGSFDFAYMPKFDPDRYVDGSRLSYWNGMDITGDEFTAEKRNEWFKDHEFSARFYRPVLSWEGSLYAYHGFWKSPVGYDLSANDYYFPRLNVYGASARGAVGNTLMNVEIGYYDSRENSSAFKNVPNDEVRFLSGYEREIGNELTAGFQYYVEWMQDYGGYSGTRDEFRHVLTLRLTKMAMNQNLMLSLFTFYSPSDQDTYIRPNATYTISDHWQASAYANVFLGEHDYTFFGQLQDNSNLGLSLRYSF
ncbi:DUF1302 family protein [Pontiella agarivorans]|uniref:Porin n=1 Tax=Pontiella agarivorans TaxID=3038953 RepID=A0ABU5MVB3_9BACT|nr:DUF1302 family protein [Pontiella agarivorans]MDZ8118128.1 hypothetical protein [Pontiella agarivorans]